MNFNYLLRQLQFHGGRQLAEKQFRRWWSLGLVLLFGLAVAVITMTILRFLSNPTYILREEIVERIKKFPTVIVCPEVIFREKKIDEFLRKIKIPPHLNASYVKSTINQLGAFYASDVIYRTHDLENMEQLLEYNNMDLETAALLLTTTCEETLIRCRWASSFVNCSKLFRMELTGDGYCCVFNGRSLKRLADNKEKEYITMYTGLNSGLMLAVNQSQKPYSVDLTYKWLAVLSSRHFIEPSVNGTPLNPGHEHWVGLQNQNFQLEEEARGLSNSLKKCRMRTDHLKYFPVYYRSYCFVECEMHRTMRRCNCFRHVYPLPEGAKYCDANNLRCAQQVKVTYGSDQCDCPLACDVPTDYITSTSFELKAGSHPLDTFYEGLDLKKVNIVRVYLQSRQEHNNIRWSYFTRLDLFSQLGGVFNLFFGSSVLTLLELAFLCVHWLRRVCKKNKINQVENILDLKDKGNTGAKKLTFVFKDRSN